MHFSKYYHTDVVNGEGTRCSLFVSGCIHACKGCYNQTTLSTTAGAIFTDAHADQIIKDLNDTRIKRQGLTLTGGDPLHPNNVETVLALIKRVQNECVDKDIWLWSGYTLGELNHEQKEVINRVNVFIDGKFDKTLHSPDLVWRGSSNQVVHRFK